jgi:hypothetical protein
LEAEAAALAPFREAIEFPNPDFAAFARACGGQGSPAKVSGELKTAVRNAYASKAPVIVDAIVVLDELPNLPNLDLEMLGHLAVAMVKKRSSRYRRLINLATCRQLITTTSRITGEAIPSCRPRDHRHCQQPGDQAFWPTPSQRSSSRMANETPKIC